MHVANYQVLAVSRWTSSCTLRHSIFLDFAHRLRDIKTNSLRINFFALNLIHRIYSQAKFSFLPLQFKGIDFFPL